MSSSGARASLGGGRVSDEVAQSLQVQTAVLRRTISTLQAHQSATERGFAMHLTEEQQRLQEALAQRAAQVTVA